MIDKFVRTAADAVAGITDGATVLVGGFGGVGQPNGLIAALAEVGCKELTIVSNNVLASKRGLQELLALGRVRRVVCSFPRGEFGTEMFHELHRTGRIELEVMPQGTLAERIRAGGAGIPAFFTRATVGTRLAQHKETRLIDGKEYVLEYALKGDVALIEAWRADRWGNLTFRGSGRNFNPVMATAAELTIAQVSQKAELGAIDPELVVTPGIFVDRVWVGGAGHAMADGVS